MCIIMLFIKLFIALMYRIMSPFDMKMYFMRFLNMYVFVGSVIYNYIERARPASLQTFPYF